jgi:hypothetical protein
MRSIEYNGGEYEKDEPYNGNGSEGRRIISKNRIRRYMKNLGPPETETI